MKRSLAVTLSLLVLAGSSMVWADAANTSKTIKAVKHHKRKHQPKPELNPQPLPPGNKAPGGQGGNKNQ